MECIWSQIRRGISLRLIIFYWSSMTFYWNLLINTAIQYRRQGLFINDVITGAGTKTTKIPQRVATSFTNGEKKGKSIFPCSLSVLHRWHLHLSALYDEHHILSYDDHHIIIQLKRPKMCYIFDKQRVQGNQIWVEPS